MGVTYVSHLLQFGINIMNYPVAELRGILKVVNYFEKPMVKLFLARNTSRLSEN